MRKCIIAKIAANHSCSSLWKCLCVLHAIPLFWQVAYTQKTFIKTISTGINFQSVYGKVLPASEKGYLIYGYFEDDTSLTYDKGFLLKTDSDFQFQWQRQYKSMVYNRVSSVVELADQTHLILGSVGAGKFDMLLLKTDSTGIPLWHKAFGYSGADELAVKFLKGNTSDFFLIGQTAINYFFYQYKDILLGKLDTAGHVFWLSEFGDSLAQEVTDALMTLDGNILIGGNNRDSSGNGSIFLMKTDTSGNILWQKSYSWPVGIWATAVAQSPDGNIYVIGSVTDPDSPTFTDIFLCKTDGQGNLLWAKRYGGSYNDDGQSLLIKPNGNVVLCGKSSSFVINNGLNALAFEVDGNGKTSWAEVYGQDGYAAAFYDIAVPTAYHFLFSGTDDFTNNAYSLCLIRTNDFGNTNCYDSIITLLEDTISLTTLALTFTKSAGPPEINRSLYDYPLSLISDTLCISTGRDDDKHSTASSLTLYPNPATSSFTVAGSYALPATLRLYDLTGRQALGAELHSNRQQVNVGQLSKGMYLLRLFSSSGTTTRKLIIR